MQRGYLILIARGALLALGIAISLIWAGSLGSRIINQNTILNGVSIYPSGAANALTQVNDLSRPLSLYSKRNCQKPEWKHNLNQ